MSRQDANAAFARTSFLYGGNAAYIEDLYAKYEADPAAVDAEWADFFKSLKDERADVVKSAQGASWKKPNWPVRENGDLVSALDESHGDLRQILPGRHHVRVKSLVEEKEGQKKMLKS